MWSAEPRGCGAGPRAVAGRMRGYSLVEAAIVIAMVASAAVVINGAVASTQEADRYIAATWKVTERGQRTAFEIASLVGQSRKLFQGDEVGLGYLQALELGPVPVAPDARLPVIDDDSPLDEDEAFEPTTGNILLFARESDPLPAVADPLLGKVRQIDTYRFLCVYPQVTNSSLVRGAGPARDLVVWRSVVYPSWSQVSEIQDVTQRKNVLKDLHKRYGCRYLWDADGAVNAAFYAFDALGNLDAAPKSPFTIPEDRDVSDRGRLVYANLQLAPSDPGTYAQRVVLGADDVDTWAPHGFEVKVTGSVRSRQIWIHLVVQASQFGNAGDVTYPATVIANCQDL